MVEERKTEEEEVGVKRNSMEGGGRLRRESE